MATCADCGAAEGVKDSPREHKDNAANATLCASCYSSAFTEVNPDADEAGGADAPPRPNPGDVSAE